MSEKRDTDNHVILRGKVSRTGELRYTPRGKAICRFALAVVQESFEGSSMGYFDVELQGDVALDWASRIRIGKPYEVRGSLWERTFRNRRGEQVKEIKMIANQIIGESNE